MAGPPAVGAVLWPFITFPMGSSAKPLGNNLLQKNTVGGGRSSHWERPGAEDTGGGVGGGAGARRETKQKGHGL